MALTEEQRIFIVQRLAMYDPPKKVVKDFQEEFGVTIDRNTVRNYEVEKRTRHIAKKLVKIYEETRRKFEEEVGAIPIAQRSFRLRRLQVIHEQMMDKGNLMAAAQVLEQAAKEAGDVFTNVTKVKGKVAHDHQGDVTFAMSEKRATLSDLIDQALRKTAKPDEVTH